MAVWLKILKDSLKRIVIYLSDLFGWRFNPERLFQITYLEYTGTQEGRIIFILTEDNEIPKGILYGSSILSPYELEVTLVHKLQVCGKIANRYGIKWTHFVDIGSGILLLKWANEVSGNNDWLGIYDIRRDALRRSYECGNDIQLHIHSYNIPYSPDFRWMYDESQNVIYRHKRKKKYRRRTFGGWASQYKEIGTEGDIFTRVGSLIYGKKVLKELLIDKFPEYKVVCFRAGGWDIGDNKEELRKSFVALIKAGIYMDSSITKGAISKVRWLTDYGMTFELGAPVDKNVYRINVQEYIGNIWEVLPVEPNGLVGTIPRYITPLDNPEWIKNIYDSLIDKNGIIKPGIHVIVEMFHIHNIKGYPEWDNLDERNGELAKLDAHFRYLQKMCPKMEYMTITELYNLLTGEIDKV
jgi:hypothetical protein